MERSESREPFGEELAEGSVDLLRAIAETAPREAPATPAMSSLVKYAAGVAEEAESRKVEFYAVRSDDGRRKLLETAAAVRVMQRTPIGELVRIPHESDERAARVREYVRLFGGDPGALYGGVAASLAAGGVQARNALAMLAVARTAARVARQGIGSSYRAANDLIAVDDAETVRAKLVETGGGIRLEFESTEFTAERTIFVAAEFGDQRVRLGSSRLGDGAFELPFGEGLPVGTRLRLRADRWPNGCEGPPVLCCLGSGENPVGAFLEWTERPEVKDGELLFGIRRISSSIAASPGILEVSVAAFAGVWQLVGEVRDLPDTSTHRFAYPAPDGAFWWPLRFVWRTTD